MKVTRLTATGVHGYLPIDVEFFPDLTFITGLNGSGKTSALQLLMALLTPKVEDFATIVFEKAEATVAADDQSIVITALRTPDGVTLTITGVEQPLSVTSAELHLLNESHRAEELRSPVHERIAHHEVFSAIASMSTPMFLGLERRHIASLLTPDDAFDAQRREVLLRRHAPDLLPLRGLGAASLADVNFLVSNRMQEIRLSQEALDDELRTRVLIKAFEYKPSDLTSFDRMPTRDELDGYRKRLAHIEHAAEQLHLPVPELTATLNAFFTQMTRVVDALEQAAKKNVKKSKEAMTPDRDFVDWVINRPQSERILEHIKLLDDYGSQRATLHEPIDRFLSLVNGFLSQTGKSVAVAGRGDLGITLAGSGVRRSIAALSSGERQILIMLAHLSLNKRLTASGVFIVDEPELSLHIDWQERFVDAIQQANPNVQLILATHSPAIILDRVAHCRSLS
jgi:predicted ATPase